MSEARFLADQLARSYEGEAWHGPALKELLEDVTPDQAAKRPLAHAHSIWEIALHIAAWERTVRLRLDGIALEEPQEGDWPSCGKQGPEEWKRVLDALAGARETLVAAVAGLDKERLGQIVAGNEYSVRFMLNGVIQHNLYHAGQIALLKKA